MINDPPLIPRTLVATLIFRYQPRLIAYCYQLNLIQLFPMHFLLPQVLIYRTVIELRSTTEVGTTDSKTRSRIPLGRRVCTVFVAFFYSTRNEYRRAVWSSVVAPNASCSSWVMVLRAPNGGPLLQISNVRFHSIILKQTVVVLVRLSNIDYPSTIQSLYIYFFISSHTKQLLLLYSSH